MAKGAILVGTFSGKLGNIVGYSLKNSSNKVTQATRAYVADVANPQTELQAIQRLKMSPAVNFYRQLGRILNNAWQGTKYGTRSRNMFMKLALTQSTGIPFIVKNDKRFYPGEYPVSIGSIPSVAISSFNGSYMYTGIITPTDATFDTTWGDFSQAIVNNNFGIKEGDKLTFICVYQTDNGEYVPAFTYVILDVSSTETTGNVLAASNINVDEVDTGSLYVGIDGFNALSIVAGAVIVSRLDENGKWLRSNSTMQCAATYLANQMGSAAYAAALASYMSSREISSDWYLNYGISGDGTSGGSASGGESSNVQVTSIANITLNSGGENEHQVAIFTMSDGTKRAGRATVSGGGSGSTQYVAFQSGQSFKYKTDFLADATELAAIKTAQSAVTTWYDVQATEADPDPVTP